jgi:hypothetical protein
MSSKIVQSKQKNMRKVQIFYKITESASFADPAIQISCTPPLVEGVPPGESRWREQNKTGTHHKT